MISVIIINYNTFKLTCDCLQSLYEKAKGVQYEVIVVDNASTECDPDLFLKKFPWINLIKSPLNLGFAKGNNLGIKYATGNYILLLNSDTVLLNDAVTLTVQEMENRKISLATCRVYYENGAIQPVAEKFPTVRFSVLGLLGIIQLARVLKIKSLNASYDYSKAQKVDWIWGCFFLFRTEVLDHFPDRKLPEDFFMYGEDMLWCYLLRAKSVFSWYLPFGEITHKFSGDKTNPDPRTNMGFRNRILFLKAQYSSFRYTSIFAAEILTSLTRLRFKYLFQKIKQYVLLR